MAPGEDEPVAVRRLRLCLSVARRVEEEHRHDLGRAAARRGVALTEWVRRRLATSCRTSTVVASGAGRGGVRPVGVFPGSRAAKGAVLRRSRHVTARPGPASRGTSGAVPSRDRCRGFVRGQRAPAPPPCGNRSPSRLGFSPCSAFFFR